MVTGLGITCLFCVGFGKNRFVELMLIGVTLNEIERYVNQKINTQIFFKSYDLQI